MANGRYTGRDDMSFDWDDSASNTTRSSTISNSFINRMSQNRIGAGVIYSGGGGGGDGGGAEHPVRKRRRQPSWAGLYGAGVK